MVLLVHSSRSLSSWYRLATLSATTDNKKSEEVMGKTKTQLSIELLLID